MRVRDLLSRMTLEEKVVQMRSAWSSKKYFMDADGNFSAEKAAAFMPIGVGQVGRPSDRKGASDYLKRGMRSIEETVAFANGVQKYLVEQTRLGIPALFHEETAHGLLAADATIFPIPPALASTWDPDLVEQAFSVAAREMRLRGGTVALSPVLDLAREPRYGRVEEFFSEDPYLTAQMGIAAARGQQGRTRPLAKDKVYVTLKHFVHAAPQGGLNLAPANISERDLRENYLVPFAAVIQEVDPAAIMPSYNEVEGVPSYASVDLLEKTGRGRLGFKGAYFSDYHAIDHLADMHHVAADFSEAAVIALRSGVDADLPEGDCYATLPALVRSGKVREEQIDAAVSRILALKFEAGLFENPYVDARRAVRNTNTAADVALARRTAQKAVVLLQNDGALPLNPNSALKLAVIGPNAQKPVLGGYSGGNAKAVGVLAGIRAAAGPKMSVEYAEGVRIVEHMPGPLAYMGPARPVPEVENRARIAEAVALANRSDVILLAVGDDPTITREGTLKALPGDRNSLDLFGMQNDLIEALIATGKPIVALLLNGRALAVNRLAEKANALIEGWYLGQEGGNAFADVLFGKVNPGGKLPVSFARSVGELPVFYNRHPSSDANHYVEGERKPLFPFGHGLSYTTFDLSAPRLRKDNIGRDEGFSVEVDVANTGTRVGDEVVQLYIRDDVSSVPRPVLELEAFRRITVGPGERQTVRFELGADALAFWDIAWNWTVEPGTFTIFAGNSSAALKATKLTVIG
jgi:beta-glucosidase